MRIAIMQPTYLSWLGYFDLMDQVDLFVLLDNVQFVKRSWQQRNRIKTPSGLQWLTVPVVVRGRFDQLIWQAVISEPDFWRRHIRALELNYGRAPYFQDFFSGLRGLLEHGDPWERLLDLNSRTIEWLSQACGIATRLIHSSGLEVQGKRSGLLASICERLEATEYLSPMGSAGYLLEDVQEFTERGVRVLFHNYTHPTYDQLFPPFSPYASVIDVLFNEGPRALEIIRSGRGQAYRPEEVALSVREELSSDDQIF